MCSVAVATGISCATGICGMVPTRDTSVTLGASATGGGVQVVMLGTVATGASGLG